MPSLDIADLRAAYGKQQVLDGISLSVGSGEILGLIGPSGSGKSTVLRVLVGLLRPQSGYIKLDGITVDYAKKSDVQAVRDRLAIVFQQYNLFQNMTVLENVTIRPGQDQEAVTCRGRSRREAGAGQGRTGRQARVISRPAFRRAAATGGHRTCPCAEA